MLKDSRISYWIIGGTGVDEFIKYITYWILMNNFYIDVGLVVADFINKIMLICYRIYIIICRYSLIYGEEYCEGVIKFYLYILKKIKGKSYKDGQWLVLDISLYVT